ncbi:hypothetical protein MANES_07G054400v8 [Manihot esculenta]|uniref:Uncharacterized protein n=1 Tax=Manihot esculenta TaxID=3983 RepID=A0ACB7HD17_MANES|nr:hypothetical protein MANES_07G054400v8 [Manihot esculenta]
MWVANCTCCQHVPPLDYLPICPSRSHPFHCCRCVPSCPFCIQNKLAFGYCVPSCYFCPQRFTALDRPTGGETPGRGGQGEPDRSTPDGPTGGKTPGRGGRGEPDRCTPDGPTGGKTPGRGGRGEPDRSTPDGPTGGDTPGRGGRGEPDRSTEDTIPFPISTNPSWSNPKLYGWGFQHCLVNVGSSLLVSSIMVNIAGGGNVEKAKAVQASLFAVGINTMLQIWIGTRLSVSMESSQAYIIPIISIALSTFSNYSDSLDSHQRYEEFMRRVQGASLISSIFQMVIGFSGLGKYFSRHLSPLASVPLVTLTGLGLYVRGFPLVAKCIEIGLPALAILVFLTQFLPRIWKAKKEMVGQVAIVLSVSIVWIYAEILTAAGAYDNTTQQTQTYCRTDSSGLIDAAPWIKIPRPFQWGTPIFEAGDALSMMAASLVAVIESSGTFLASSKLSGAPPIPPSALTRGIGTQGIGTMIDAVFGTGNGSTASGRRWSIGTNTSRKSEGRYSISNLSGFPFHIRKSWGLFRFNTIANCGSSPHSPLPLCGFNWS